MDAGAEIPYPRAMTEAPEPRRVVSLIASATEIVCALGLRGRLVGRSHECDHPPGVEELPACTAPRFATGGSSAAIDARVRELVREGLSIYDLDGRTARLVSRLPTGGFAVDLVSYDGLLYVANGNDGVRIARVSDDGTAEWIGQVTTGLARDLVVRGAHAVLADGGSGLKVIDVLDPRNPRIIGHL